MPAWEGNRKIIVITACMNANGTPDFAVNEVEVTQDQAENGIHYYLAEAMLMENGYEEPFVHFDEDEAPGFLLPAVQEYLGMQGQEADPAMVVAGA